MCMQLRAAVDTQIDAIMYISVVHLCLIEQDKKGSKLKFEKYSMAVGDMILVTDSNDDSVSLTEPFRST